MRASMCSIGWQTKDKYVPVPPIAVAIGEVAERIAAAGFDGIEVWEPHIAQLDPVALAALRAQLIGLKLAVPMLSAYYNFTKSPEDAARSLAHGHRVLAEARAIGATAIRIFTGNSRGGDATPEQWQRCVACLRELCDAAAGDGITLAAEIHDWNLMDTADNAARLVDAVERANCKLIFHPSAFMPDPRPALRRLAAHVHHVHATNKDAAGKDATLAAGVIDYPALVAELDAVGFAGFLSVEYFGAQPDERARIEGPYLRGLLTARV